jgi:RNA polymerase sigma-70 factor, ECF subfamily
VALSEIDRNLLERCLAQQPKAWEDFVDRFMGLVVHVITHSAQSRSVRLGVQDREDLCAEVFLAIIRDDFAVLRHFRGQSSLATYLTVIARRVAVRELLRHQPHSEAAPNNRAARSGGNGAVPHGASPHGAPLAHTTPNGNGPVARVSDGHSEAEQRVDDRDQVERLLRQLDGHEATIVRMYHIEGKSYQEISTATGIAENSVGPTLSRARQKLRNANDA